MSELAEVLGRLGSPRLLVLGDLILDRYTHGTAGRISPEAPVPVLLAGPSEVRAGGAAAVAVLAAALGARVRLAGLVGADAESWRLRRLLDGAGVEHGAVLDDPGRPTSVKERFTASLPGGPAQQLLRVDREERAPPSAERQRQLLAALEQGLRGADALLVADYGKGVCAPGLLTALVPLAGAEGLPVLVDPALGADYGAYRGAELLAPNRAEAERALGRSLAGPMDALAAARRLCEGHDCEAVAVKLDRDGLVLAARGEPDRHYPALARNVCDVTGAGDMVLAVLGLCRACGLGWDESARLACAGAALQVGRPGVAAITRAELAAALAPCGSAAKVVSVDQMAELAEGYRRQGRRVVLSNGCFDLLHAGHLACLEEAARLGEVLCVAVNADDSVRRLKGPGRPVVPQQERALLLAALDCVSHVAVFSEDTPHELLRHVRPDVLVKGGDYTAEQVAGREVVQAYGGRMCVTGHCPGPSTTQRLAQLRAPCQCPPAQAAG
jgi:D-beta-D-heptose 7-phosphate kinase/D-beta-D-heptose 1-phosphate adenosyltransferase